MGLFTRKADPITSKAKALNEQIASLEVEIKKLQRKAERKQANGAHGHGTAPPQTARVAQPVVRSTATPQASRPGGVKSVVPREPIFESVEQAAPAGAPDEANAHYNDLGVRKYDIGAAWRRLQRLVRGPSAHNPKLVSYLAAGSIRGLRPLRYEKRIARNRFIALTIFFVVILWSMLGLFFSHR